jgi:hypothetical protein
MVSAKMVLALVGAAIFAYGVRYADVVVRWVGMGFIAVAFLARFVKSGPRS